MIQPERLYHFLKEHEISFYAGVPDSLLKYFLKYVQDHTEAVDHICTANEGLAVALATGYHFRTGKVPVVYLQNSGLGNLINPLTSMSNKEMYSVPILLLIGWRGRPGTKDEPQHRKMGLIISALLDILEVPFWLLDENEVSSFAKINEAVLTAKKVQSPVALLVQENVFDVYDGVKTKNEYSLIREDVIKNLISHLRGNELVVCTTGKSGREFYEQNKIAGNKINKYLLNVGAMGHANHLGLGMKINSDVKVIVLDGDGSLLMQMGSLPTVAKYAKENFIHIVINNGSHESVGGQPTEGFFADCCGIAKASGYRKTICITNESELNEWLQTGLNNSELQFVEIRTNIQSRENPDRPSSEPVAWKKQLMESLRKKDR